MFPRDGRDPRLHAAPPRRYSRIERHLRGDNNSYPVSPSIPRLAGFGPRRLRGCSSCIDWSMRPRWWVINHLAPLSTRRRCTFSPWLFRIARRSWRRRERKRTRISAISFVERQPVRDLSRGILAMTRTPAVVDDEKNPGLGAGRRLLPSRTFTPSFLLYLWFRGAVDPRKNAPHGTVSSSASTLDEADRRIMQSRLTRRSSTTFARPSPSIIGRGSSVVVALLPDDSSSESSLLASLLARLGISRVRFLVRETRDCIRV